MTNNYPKFSQKKLDNIKNTMQVLCSKGFYKDIGWEVGTNLKNEKKSLFKGFVGQSDILANKNSIWRIFSMTKPFVSILSLKLIEEGKIRLLANSDHRFFCTDKKSRVSWQMKSAFRSACYTTNWCDIPKVKIK